MKKKVLRCALCFVLLSSLLFFSFSVSAAEEIDLSFYPIPPLYVNWQYGTNLSWLQLDNTSDANMAGTSYTMTQETKNIWNYYLPGSASIQNIDQFNWSTTAATSSNVATFSVDFTGVENYNSIFDLSTYGYAQFWFEFMVDGRNGNGLYFPGVPEVDVYIVGNRTRAGDVATSGDILDDMEYLYYHYGSGTPKSFLNVNQAPFDYVPASGFSHCYVGLCGATITSSSLRSNHIRYIIIKVRYPSYQTKYADNGHLYLSRINYRRYDPDGESLDSSSAPSLDPTTKAEADLEANIQNSIAKGNDQISANIAAGNQQINNRIDSLEQSFDSDMDYTKPDDSTSTNFIQDWTAYLRTLNSRLGDMDTMYSNALELATYTIDHLSTYLHSIYDNIPLMFRGLLTAVVVILVSRKAIGR